MKSRNGFVSNSSSSSFIIKLKHISAVQLSRIQRHEEITQTEDAWYISLDVLFGDEEYVCGSTYLDNFDMREYLDLLEIKSKYIKWDD